MRTRCVRVVGTPSLIHDVADDYPGLAEHPQHALAGKLFDGGPNGQRYGAILTITPRGGRAAGYHLADGLSVGMVATSLGGTQTVVSHVASTTHRQLDDAALAAGGIDPGAVRFSIGLEDPEDLISDAYVALESLSRPLSFLGFYRSSGGRVTRKVRVAVVFGGRSTEHAVSCASAGLVLSAIDRDRYDVLPIGIARDGRWVLTSDDPGRLALSAGSSPSVEAVAVPGASIVPMAGSLTVSSPGEVPRDLGQVDVVLPLLHGSYGEDGTIQGLLEMTGTRYAGAGVFASAAGMDKEYMKLIMAARGLPLGRYVVVRDRDWSSGVAERKRVLDEIAELGWPVFVKPARGGSSIGITRVSAFPGLADAVEAARVHDPKVLAEAAVDGL